jgi:hypothetical protein
MSFVESGGLIFAGACPGSHLISLDPQTGKLANYGQMDPAGARR